MKPGSTFHAPIKVVRIRGERITVIEVNGQRFVWDNNRAQGKEKK